MRHADALIAEVASEQENVFSLSQLLFRGVSQGAIERRLRSGHIVVVHRGVYALAGARLTQRGRWKAATLISDSACLSYRSAAAFWQMRNSWREPVEITLPRQAKPRKGLVIHHEQLAPDEWSVIDGLPVTTPARTLLDLAAVLSPFALERALHESEFRDHTSPTSIPALLQRHPRRRGSRPSAPADQRLAAGRR